MSARKKRTVLAIAQKVEILDKIATDASPVDLAKEYGVTESAVCKIKKKAVSIRELWEAGRVKVKSL